MSQSVAAKRFFSFVFIMKWIFANYVDRSILILKDETQKKLHWIQENPD